MAARKTQKFVDGEGQYLVDTEERNALVIGWYIPEWEDIGYVLANEDHPGNEPGNVESQLCTDELRIFFKERKLDLPATRQAFEFPTQKMQKEAISVLNCALCFRRDNKEWPAWTKDALAAGWTPPKGWKP